MSDHNKQGRRSETFQEKATGQIDQLGLDQHNSKLIHPFTSPSRRILENENDMMLTDMLESDDDFEGQEEKIKKQNEFSFKNRNRYQVIQ